MRGVVVTGWRGPLTAKQVEFVQRHVRLEMDDDSCLFVGDAKGVDAAAWKLAQQEKYSYQRFIADWNKFGNAAGPERNLQMCTTAAELCDSCVILAFPHGDSRGTWNCLRTASKLGFIGRVAPLVRA